MYTASTAFLEALQEANVSYIFANLGSDHPAMIESLAEAKQLNKKLPEVIVCPNEMVALSAAHGYAQITGEVQAVIIHVECGTQNLGGAIHNAAKGRVPVLIFAGASPFTQEGELAGSRNEFIHWIQDVFDQRGIMRGYTKYNNEIRTGKNVKQLVHRAMQFATSDPKGPVYLMGAREVMEEEIEPITVDTNLWEPIMPSAIPPNAIKELAADLLKAQNPLIITSYLGRNEQAVNELIELCEHVSIPVIESCPNYMNFPTTHPLHCGHQWNTPSQNELIAEADFILVLDSDVPWIPLKNKPSNDAIIYYIDVDPIKEQMPLWYIPSKRFFKADSYTALQQLNMHLKMDCNIDSKTVEERLDKYSQYHTKQKDKLKELECSNSEHITPEYLTACVREIIDHNTIIMNEGISNYPTISNHLELHRSGTLFGSGAGSLGWNGGAAIGAKLAKPDKTVISLTGDGSYLFSIPSTVHWMANRYNTPFLTIIYNNHGWKSPKLSTLGVHPNGIAQQTNEFFVDFGTISDLSKIAEAAGGAYARSVKNPADLKDALTQCLNVVKEGRAAVLDVHIPTV
ncbi:thiamine pyrophosphate-requiring protein [Halalkalibacter krulwichiae]|uniref:Benzoylformate decarboxylase n=1 Tax=Halalkalibacter krulwichiae TaxID=199441 RepID=A0A1X9M5Z8_9BACI|nr:thiamine pyrophosphate-requiring protein [Halalkalibacter krulwichiae]ARK28867.1 Benzoylformate decarboxylase [Halalkalibacter krulwichiae]